MYAFDWTGSFRAWLSRVRSPQTWRRVAPNVWFIGLTSLLTDISSEMVVSILPLYLVVGLGLSPLVFGVVDGLYPGATAVVRWAAGLVGDRSRQHKGLAAAGYAVSAASRLAWMPAGAWLPGLMAIVTADRLGKGIRTAPRDALISLSTPREALGAAFGVHRAMDAAGAMLGPLTAAAVLVLAPRRFDVVFVLSFAVAVVGLGVLVLFVRNPPVVPSGDLPPAAPRRLVPRVRGLWFTLAAGALLSLLTISDGFIYLVLQRRTLIAADSLPLLYAGTNLTYLLLAAPLGALSDRTQRWRMFALGHVCLALVYGVLLIAAGGPATVGLVLVLLGAYYAATEGVLAAMASAVLPPDERGSGLGLVSTATSLGRMGASLVFGWTWTTWGDGVALTAFAASLPAGLLLASTLLSRAEREIISA